LKKLICIAFFTTAIVAQPHIPSNPNMTLLILEKNEINQKISLLKKNLASDKENLNIVKELTSLYIKLAKEKSDIKYMGYAKALLLPYLEDNRNNYDLQMHYVDILQYTHHFDKALIEVDKAIQIDSKKGQPFLTKASIYQAQTKYAWALQSCKKLVLRSSPLITATCITEAKSHLGKLDSSYTLLQSVYKKSLNNEKKEKLWALSSLSDMAYRLNKKEESLKYLEEALVLNPKDYYILKKISNIYLDQRQYDKVIELLHKYDYVESLLLRLTLAEERLHRDNIGHKAELSAYVKILTLRKESVHKEDKQLFMELGI